jgi:hypothetical protein
MDQEVHFVNRSFSRTLWNQTSWLSLQVVAQVAFTHRYQLETQVFSIYCKYMLLCGCGYFWLKVCLSGHARLVNFGSLSFLLFSHFILPVRRVKLMSHTIDMIFSALRGVNAWPQWYWFWSFYMGFWNYQKWHFMSRPVETKSTKMLSLKLTTISSAYKFTRILNFSTL